MVNCISRVIPDPSVNLARIRVLTKLRVALDLTGVSNVLVVGGGSQRQWLDPLMRAVHQHCVVYSDIDATADVDLFCDAHDLPFVDGAFDAVVTTAVLEHVLYPERVAVEIARVLKQRGLIYSELPFMQQVHEGAYDFTRYSLSGHRRLFNQFDEVDAGMVAGPATAFVWALEHLILAFFSRPVFRNVCKVVVRLLFGWIKYLDCFFENQRQAMDGASCTYFFGAKSQTRVLDRDIVARYVGGGNMRHV
jgi:SAM-dependent methyltransferase